ncbi:hypothetical protein BESB_011230 [Besnoitia besnoiti]|uniref:Uncharacterized protein n=1 Tax=Besnoitia besnoiti TaxID=94643 RepID=A0A2A9MPV5_BESBE|nr:hypothetical protein BESB_011230 [Besnoitia besnoiti]PFH38781.1 hypothetical protein BESB_011230 [Besnoitia besnoiti]
MPASEDRRRGAAVRPTGVSSRDSPAPSYAQRSPSLLDSSPYLAISHGSRPDPLVDGVSLLVGAPGSSRSFASSTARETETESDRETSYASGSANEPCLERLRKRVVEARRPLDSQNDRNSELSDESGTTRNRTRQPKSDLRGPIPDEARDWLPHLNVTPNCPSPRDSECSSSSASSMTRRSHKTGVAWRRETNDGGTTLRSHPSSRRSGGPAGDKEADLHSEYSFFSGPAPVSSPSTVAAQASRWASQKTLSPGTVSSGYSTHEPCVVAESPLNALSGVAQFHVFPGAGAPPSLRSTAGAPGPECVRPFKRQREEGNSARKAALVPVYEKDENIATNGSEPWNELSCQLSAAFSSSRPSDELDDLRSSLASPQASSTSAEETGRDLASAHRARRSARNPRRDRSSNPSPPLGNTEQNLNNTSASSWELIVCRRRKSSPALSSSTKDCLFSHCGSLFGTCAAILSTPTPRAPDAALPAAAVGRAPVVNRPEKPKNSLVKDLLCHRNRGVFNDEIAAGPEQKQVAGTVGRAPSFAPPPGEAAAQATSGEGCAMKAETSPTEGLDSGVTTQASSPSKHTEGNPVVASPHSQHAPCSGAGGVKGGAFRPPDSAVTGERTEGTLSFSVGSFRSASSPPSPPSKATSQGEETQILTPAAQAGDPAEAAVEKSLRRGAETPIAYDSCGGAAGQIHSRSIRTESAVELTATERALACVGKSVTSAIETGAASLADFLIDALPHLSPQPDYSQMCTRFGTGVVRPRSCSPSLLRRERAIFSSAPRALSTCRLASACCGLGQDLEGRGRVAMEGAGVRTNRDPSGASCRAQELHLDPQGASGHQREGRRRLAVKISECLLSQGHTPPMGRLEKNAGVPPPGFPSHAALSLSSASAVPRLHGGAALYAYQENPHVARRGLVEGRLLARAPGLLLRVIPEQPAHAVPTAHLFLPDAESPCASSLSKESLLARLVFSQKGGLAGKASDLPMDAAGVARVAANEHASHLPQTSGRVYPTFSGLKRTNAEVAPAGSSTHATRSAATSHHLPPLHVFSSVARVSGNDPSSIPPNDALPGSARGGFMRASSLLAALPLEREVALADGATGTCAAGFDNPFGRETRRDLPLGARAVVRPGSHSPGKRVLERPHCQSPAAKRGGVRTPRTTTTASVSSALVYDEHTSSESRRALPHSHPVSTSSRAAPEVTGAMCSSIDVQVDANAGVDEATPACAISSAQVVRRGTATATVAADSILSSRGPLPFFGVTSGSAPVSRHESPAALHAIKEGSESGRRGLPSPAQIQKRAEERVRRGSRTAGQGRLDSQSRGYSGESGGENEIREPRASRSPMQHVHLPKERREESGETEAMPPGSQASKAWKGRAFAGSVGAWTSGTAFPFLGRGEKHRNRTEVNPRREPGPRRASAVMQARWLRDELRRQWLTGALTKESFPMEEVLELMKPFDVLEVHGISVYKLEDGWVLPEFADAGGRPSKAWVEKNHNEGIEFMSLLQEITDAATELYREPDKPVCSRYPPELLQPRTP